MRNARSWLSSIAHKTLTVFPPVDVNLSFHV
jgi:hypothetical protein